MKKKIHKIVAVYLAINILFQVVSPTVALALTTGPSQPEMQSFEPIGTTEMVDPFSGDFNYNIPLMTVPGPNGGYPVNLAYHAGIGMEEEASWVGLGWNINAGEINRQMRGLPDDFNGDAVVKTMYMKPNITASVKAKTSIEMVSMDGDIGLGLSLSTGLTYNSYHGIGITQGIGFSIRQRDSNSMGMGVNSNYNSLSGEQDLTTSLSYSKKENDTEKKYGLSFSYGSVQGAKRLSFSYSKEERQQWVSRKPISPTQFGDDKFVGRSGTGAGVSFSGSSYIPYSEMPKSGFSIGASGDFGADVWMVNPYVGAEVFYTQDKIKENQVSFNGYGYIYSQAKKAGDSHKFALMDFNREKDAPLTKDIPAMPMPIFTNDIYSVQGQGIGAVFRPFRSDIGILHDPEITTKNYGADLGMEASVGSTIKVATDVTVSYSKGYSGPWRDGNSWAQLKGENNYEFNSSTLQDPLFEPAYFRGAGDMTANYDESATSLQGVTTALPITLVSGFSLSDFSNDAIAEMEQPLVDIKVSKGLLGATKMTARPSRSQMMAYHVNDVLESEHPDAMASNNTIYNLNYHPRQAAAHPASSPDYTSRPSHHIGEITVVNPDGNIYIYGIAAYNMLQKEVSFSVEGNVTGANNSVNSDKKLVNYEKNDASGSNSKGDDHFYSCKALPPYAHSYLLTAIVSPDYVDLTRDGLTEDDYGYYVKFNYSKMPEPFKWRSPFIKANYIEGYEARNANDDKAGYMYGNKEIWYLNSIETKTHIAEFTLSARKDGFGPKYEENGAYAAVQNHGAGEDANLVDTDAALQKLDRIDLYSKADPNYIGGTPTPVKTVHFSYTYDLCGHVQNNANVNEGTEYYSGKDRNANRGKLTLKKVWFSYMDNLKGSVSPYEFDYHERSTYGGSINTDENPDFSTMQMDRWGNYKSEAYDAEDPYTDQASETTGQETIRNNNASAWCLKEITLPSGGKIKVDYESDDYAFVQNKGAMQMAKIAGTGHMVGSNPAMNSTAPMIDDNNLLVFFELESQYDKDASGNTVPVNRNTIWKYIKNINEMYFKSHQRLKHEYIGGPFSNDYVSGYAKLDASDAPDVEDGSHYGVYEPSPGHFLGYVKVKPVNVHDNNNSGGDKTHPFRKAGWQYLKLNRPDLLYPSGSTSLSDNPAASELLALVSGVVGFFTSTIQMFSGFYNYCALNGYCNQLAMNKSSFIRLNSPDNIKFGGGHRVKKIAIEDTWAQTGSDDLLSEYGQEYTYRLADGSSSGVAQYEPLIGGDEIALREPVRYSSDYLLLKHDNLYLEKPYCESYYPGPGVGYSRVIVKGITHKDEDDADVTKSVQGITVYEYYTAKDFPVRVNASNLIHKSFTPDLSIPFIGDVSFENHGCSQTFTVESNNMHGQMKSVATYAYGTNLMSPLMPSPVSKTEYLYKTDAPYTAAADNHLNNEVDVLYADAFNKKSNLGMTKEFFIDMRERSSVSMTNGGQINMELNFYPPVPVFTFVPKVSYGEGLNKSVVGMNVINRNGILMETRQYSEGSMAGTKNLMFDAATGKPLLTQLTNDFDNPVYTYNYASQWAYDGMGAAYKNTSARYSLHSTGAGGNFTLVYPSGGNPKEYFAAGDEVRIVGYSGPYWVTAVSGTALTLRDITNGAPFVGSTLNYDVTIVRSGRKNHLSASNGKIVSLSNPVTGRKFPLFDAWNAFVADNGVLPSAHLDMVDCATSKLMRFNVSMTSNIVTFSSTAIDGHCNNCECEDMNIGFPSAMYTVYTLKKMGEYVMATELNAGTLLPTGNTMVGVWKDPRPCLKECLDDVLHADALIMKHDWSYDYDDVDNNQMENNAHSPYDGLAAGKAHIWRPKSSWVYQVNRKRSSPATDIAKDGTYENFVLFDWAHEDNANWTWAAEVTKYNPYGYEIENKDPLSIYTSALYGYNNSVPVAIASNSSYYETAFDGFEDYKNADYSTAATGHKHGHINLAVNGSGSLAINDASHTGSYSMQIPSGASARFTTVYGSSSYYHFKPQGSKKYIISAWFKGDAGTTPSITIPSGGSVVSTSLTEPVEGWRKCDVVFTYSGSGAMTFDFNIASSSLKLLDDIRITPFESGVKTFVYDVRTLWLLAELDNQNFATFYNYDQEGTLVQVKKETAEGVRTIKTTRSNIKRKL